MQLVAVAGLAVGSEAAFANDAEDAAHFAEYIRSLWPAAQAEGVTRSTFDNAFKNVRLDRELMASANQQAEFVKPIWVYLSSAVSTVRINAGKAKYASLRTWLTKAHDVFGGPIARS